VFARIEPGALHVAQLDTLLAGVVEHLVPDELLAPETIDDLAGTRGGLVMLGDSAVLVILPQQERPVRHNEQRKK
jgi:hypothetical protein